MCIPASAALQAVSCNLVNVLPPVLSHRKNVLRRSRAWKSLPRLMDFIWKMFGCGLPIMILTTPRTAKLPYIQGEVYLLKVELAISGCQSSFYQVFDQGVY
jgi:hypothetical protein